MEDVPQFLVRYNSQKPATDVNACLIHILDFLPRPSTLPLSLLHVGKAAVL
jgi:hypothetical protein